MSRTCEGNESSERCSDNEGRQRQRGSAHTIRPAAVWDPRVLNTHHHHDTTNSKSNSPAVPAEGESATYRILFGEHVSETHPKQSTVRRASKTHGDGSQLPQQGRDSSETLEFGLTTWRVETIGLKQDQDTKRSQITTERVGKSTTHGSALGLETMRRWFNIPPCVVTSAFLLAAVLFNSVRKQRLVPK